MRCVWSGLQRAKDDEKGRAATGRKAARLARPDVTRRTNMATVRCEDVESGEGATLAIACIPRPNRGCATERAYPSSEPAKSRDFLSWPTPSDIPRLSRPLTTINPAQNNHRQHACLACLQSFDSIDHSKSVACNHVVCISWSEKTVVVAPSSKADHLYMQGWYHFSY